MEDGNIIKFKIKQIYNIEKNILKKNEIQTKNKNSNRI